MKKFLLHLFAFTLIALITLSSCATAPGGEPSTEAPSRPDVDETLPSDQADHAGNSNVEADPLPVYADSVDELISKIEAIKQEKASDINNIAALRELIVPNFSVEGYELLTIEVSQFSILYYYIPSTVSRDGALVDRDRDIVIAVRRSEYVDQEDPLQPLIDQSGITPNEDGYLYDKIRREITFAYGDVWVSVTAPESFQDYQAIKALCSVETVKLN